MAPFKFIKCKVGLLKINYDIGMQVKIRIHVDKVILEHFNKNID